LFGYSAGADSAVLYTQMLADNKLTKLELMGPAFGTTNVSINQFVDLISNLGIDVLIIDKARKWEDVFRKTSNLTEYSTDIYHFDMDDSIGIMQTVYGWPDDSSAFKYR
jgi:NH3-dependent NAD+ synthetase